MTTQTWRYNKARLQKTAVLLFLAVPIFGVFSMAHWFGAVLALVAAALGVHTLIIANNTSPVLTIGPDGLRYTRFSSRTVPWSDIAEVAIVRGVRRGVAWGKVFYKPTPITDELTFALTNYDGYSGALRNALRGLHTMQGLLGVRCVVSHLDGATVDDVARAIHAHWKGQIQDMTPINGKFERSAWTGTPPPLP